MIGRLHGKLLEKNPPQKLIEEYGVANQKEEQKKKKKKHQ